MTNIKKYKLMDASDEENFNRIYYCYQGYVLKCDDKSSIFFIKIRLYQ
jgi:hypothetical protein